MNFDGFNQQNTSFGYNSNNSANNNYSYSGGNDYSYGGSGGGFDNNAGGGAGWMSTGGGGTDDDSKMRGGYKNTTLRPVNIKQLNEAPVTTGDMPVLIDGEELRQITIVGVVRNIVQQPVNITYSVEDGTGKIDVRMWLNDNSDGTEGQAQTTDSGIAIGKYVRIYGELKFFNNSRTVSAHKIRPITDHNEITYHGLEVTYVHLCKTRGQPSSLQPANGSAVSAPYLAGNNMSRPGMLDDGMTPVRSAILEVIKTAPPNPEGVSVSVVQQNLAGRFQISEITNAISWLTSEGHLFNTIDDQHIQSTTMF
ncbi:Replication factor A protein 2 [Coemansia brasiliensis]|uniref:Replication factor A protein 2 n=1 Tax=Coemansia brasiliensis TaxID=2650707 RepID=A0A9W8I9F2_9FUNG|nr:Replication factor A protein 2 [Coemansia brasiliensis]